VHFFITTIELEFIYLIVAGIPKGQYKGYTCPQCQKTKVSAQHHRQKEKKKRTGTSIQEKGINGKGTQPSVPDSGPKPSSVVKKQPIINPQGLLEAILADCSADPSNFHPLKNSFKKLLQIQRSFKVHYIVCHCYLLAWSFHCLLPALCRTRRMHWFSFGSLSPRGENSPWSMKFL
jgi:hypothetical protein